MSTKNQSNAFLMLAAVLAVIVSGCAGMPRQPQVLPTVADTFGAPYDAVWDATVRNLGVVRLLVADKATGRIQTEPFPYTYFMTDGPSPSPEPVRLAALAPQHVLLAQTGSGGDNKPTQVIWIAMLINVNRVAENRTQVQVVPRIHDSLLDGFTPGPTNNPWVDLFGKIRTTLGLRG